MIDIEGNAGMPVEGASALGLPQSGEAGLDGKQLRDAIPVVERKFTGGKRPWTDQGHFTDNDVPQLR